MPDSSLRKAFARRSLIQLLVLAALLFAVAATMHWGSQGFGTPPNLTDYGAMLAFFVCFGLLQWIVLKNTLSRLLDTHPAASVRQAVKTAKRTTSPAEEKKRDNADKRLFVHLFSVLQREGRLLDFLQEDLSAFDDAQIGAAVRSVHAHCSS